MSQPGAIGHGVPPRPNDVQRELRDLQRQIDQMHGMIVQATNAANAASLVTISLQQDVSSVSLPSDNTFHNYCVTSPAMVPEGYAKVLLVIFATAGTTFTASGNIAVQAALGGFGGLGAAVDDGTSGGPCSVAAAYAGVLESAPGNTFTVSANVAANGAMTAGAGNVHVSGFATFMRS